MRHCIYALGYCATLLQRMDGADRELNVSRRARTERRLSELLLADLAAIRDLGRELGVVSDAADFDTGLTTDANPAERRG